MRRAEFDHAGAEQTRAMDAFGHVQERLQQSDGFEDFERPGLDGGRARFAVRTHIALDEPGRDAVSSEFGGGEKAGRASPNDQYFV